MKQSNHPYESGDVPDTHTTLEPDWDPPRDDVLFDHDAAGAAAQVCRYGAAVADEAARLRALVGTEARNAWHGVFADLFDQQLDDVLAQHAEIAHALLRLASRIDQAAAEASAEQRRRQVLRDRWEDEYRRNREAAEPA